MNIIGIIFCISHTLVGVLLIAMSIPLAKGKVKMSRWYGFKIAKAYESDDNWYKINRHGAKGMITWSILLVVSGLLAPFLPFGTKQAPNVPLLAVYCALPLLVLIPCIGTLLYARKL